MFDWARGALLKQLIKHEKYTASWDPSNTIWLKNWSVPWVFGLVEFNPSMNVLDVGCATPLLLQHIHQRFGCGVHALDVETDPEGNVHFGFGRERLAAFPEVRFHFGLAGDEVLPAEEFDFVSCISVLEHTYDRVSPLDRERPLAHVNVLRDLVRMLKPGGRWINHGALLYPPEAPLARRYCREEIFDLAAREGFEIGKWSRASRPYLVSPLSGSGKIESTLTFEAVR